MDQKTWRKPFWISSVCREDLRGMLADDEIARLDNADMKEIAKQMANAYCETRFWPDLRAIAKRVLKG